jgi:hypothetical protein
MVHDGAPSFGTNPETTPAANKAMAAPLTQEQREFARLIGRLLAKRWISCTESEPLSPFSTSGDASGRRSV